MADKTIILSKDPSQLCQEIPLIEGDNNTYVIRFVAPRYSGGVDLANLTWGVNIKNATLEQGFVNLSSATSDDSAVYIDWNVGSFATALHGSSFCTIEGRNNSSSAHPVWKSSVVTLRVGRAISADDIIDGSDIDSITEIAENVAESIVNNSVRYDTSQSLNSTQKTTARTNIGAVSQDEVQQAVATETSAREAAVAAEATAREAADNELKSAINNDNGFLDLGTLIPDTYIQSSNGQAAHWYGNSATDFIDTCGADKLIVYIASTNPYNENAFYRSDKSFISSFGLVNGFQEITVPPETRYVRFSNVDANIATLSVAINPNYRLYNTARLAKIGAAMVFPSSNIVPQFSKNGTDINFFCSSMIGVRYNGDEQRFQSLYITPMEESITIPHDSWCIWNIDTNAIQMISDTNLRANGDAKYGILFYNSSGNVRGPFERYVINNRITSQEPYIWKGNFIIAPYGTANLSIETEGTTISVTCDRYVVYNDMTLNWRMLVRTSNPTISVPHDKFLVYKNSSHDLAVLTDAEIAALTDKEYYVLFYNSNGKMCGPFEIIYNRYKCSELENVLTNNASVYPDYYDTHIKTKARKINSELAELTVGDAFVFISDIHYPDNRMYSPALVRDICNKTGISSVILNGDYINRETNKNDALIQINKVCSYYEYPNIDTYRVVGNHEFNNPGASSDPEYIENELSAAELRWAILNPNRNKVVYDTNSLSYYFDNEKEKIRYFVGAVTRSSATVADSIRWIAGQVENVPSDWGVVIFQHTVLTYSGNVVSVVNEHFENILNAMKAKTAYNYLGTTFDYTGKTFEFIACFCGDWHLDMEYTTTDGAKIIATTCDCYGQQEGSLERIVATYTEQAFDVVVIDRTLKKIFMTRIGAGVDREYSY